MVDLFLSSDNKSSGLIMVHTFCHFNIQPGMKIVEFLVITVKMYLKWLLFRVIL